MYIVTTFLIFLMVFGFIGISVASENLKPVVMDLWPDGAPGDNGITEPEKESVCGVTNVSKPEIIVYLPPKDKATGSAVVVIPGGGYSEVCLVEEGHGIADLLIHKGIAAIVVKYRLPNGYKDIPAMDARRAIRTVRYNAEKWNIDPSKIGVWGFSAGGHLASTVATVFDSGNNDAAYPIEKQSSRPDFAVLFYPVISMKDGVTHSDSRKCLLGPDPSKSLIEQYSNENRVSDKTPPTFMLHCSDDGCVPVENSLGYYRSMIQHDNECELLIFEKGSHGPGAFKGNPSWESAFDSWLQSHKIK